MTSDLATLANDHWIAAYRRLIADVGGDLREFGTVHAFVCRLPLHFANGCMVLDPADPADLATAIEWVHAAGIPYRVRIDLRHVSGLLEVVARHGLVRDPEPMPGMVMRPIPVPPAAPPAVTVRIVDQRLYPDYIRIHVETGLPAEWAAEVFPVYQLDDTDTAMILGFLDGRPAGTSLVIRTGESAGVYAVNTVEWARRRGVGTAVTWAAVSVARDWGCRAVVLQASAMGFPVYRAMEFESVVEYARFLPKDRLSLGAAARSDSGNPVADCDARHERAGQQRRQGQPAPMEGAPLAQDGQNDDDRKDGQSVAGGREPRLAG